MAFFMLHNHTKYEGWKQDFTAMLNANVNNRKYSFVFISDCCRFLKFSAIIANANKTIPIAQQIKLKSKGKKALKYKNILRVKTNADTHITLIANDLYCSILRYKIINYDSNNLPMLKYTTSNTTNIYVIQYNSVSNRS